MNGASRLLGALLLSLAANAMAESATMNNASLWQPMGTGKVTVSQDNTEHAVRFESVAEGKRAHTLWPLLPTSEGLFGLAALRFEMKLLPENAKITAARIHFADQDGVSGQFPFAPPQPGDYGKIRVAFDRPGFDPAKARTLQIVVGTDSPSLVCLVRGMTLCDRNGKEVDLRSAKQQVQMTFGRDIRSFFANPGEPQTLPFRTKSLPDGRELVYEIRDYVGQPTGQAGKATVKAGALSVTETFPIGYYEILFPELDLTFGVASLPPFEGKPDPYYAIEGLISSRSSHMRELIDLMVRGGIHSNREWCNYPALERVRGTISTDRDAFYAMGGEAGFRSIFCFADFPGWYYDGGKKVGRRPPPRRLLGLDQSVATLIERRRAGLLAFHILNEYDIYRIPGEAYMPAIKTAGYAMADSDLPLVGAPFCRGAGASVTSSIDNGLLDYVDVFSFHSYSDPERTIDLIATYRGMMADHPKAAMPIWITESGKPWHRGLPPERIVTTHGGPLGNLHPQPKEDMTSAMWITMRAVEAKAGGAAKHFAFTLPFFQENNNNFGLMDYHYTPLRSLVAYMQNVRELAGKQYLGDWRRKPAGVRVVRVFGNQEQTERTAVLYTGTEEPCTVTLADLPWRSAHTIDGRDLSVSPQGEIRFAGGLAYVSLTDAPVPPRLLATDTKAMELLQQARSYRPVPRISSPIVYQFDNWSYPQRTREYYRDESNIFRVNVFNFGDKSARIAPQLVLPEGTRIIQAPQPAEQTIPPRSEAQLVWKLDNSDCPTARYDIRLTDSLHPHAGICVPFLNWSGLRAETLDFMNPTRWRHNSSGKSTFAFDEAEKAVKVSTAFDFAMNSPEAKGRNYWVFPEYVLDLPKESLAGAVAISLELKFRQGNNSPRVTSPLVMFAYQDANEKGKYDSVTYGEPTGEWQKFTVPIDATKTELYRMIRIGMCPTAPQIDYWMRGITLHYQRK